MSDRERGAIVAPIRGSLPGLAAAEAAVAPLELDGEPRLRVLGRVLVEEDPLGPTLPLRRPGMQWLARARARGWDGDGDGDGRPVPRHTVVSE